MGGRGIVQLGLNVSKLIRGATAFGSEKLLATYHQYQLTSSSALNGPGGEELNQKLNAFYQTRNPLTGGLSPREWLKDKTLQQNYDFGRWALSQVSK